MGKVSSERQDPHPYWQAQIQAVLALRHIGIGYRPNERIDPFSAMRKMRKMSYPAPLMANAWKALTLLVELRKQGLELPRGEDGKYL